MSAATPLRRPYYLVSLPVVALLLIGLAATLAPASTVSGRPVDETPRLHAHDTFSVPIDRSRLDRPPVAIASQPTALADILLSESFESPGWPVSPWQVFDNNGITGGEYKWENRCSGKSRTTGAWAIGGGATGTMLACGSQYPNNLLSVAIAGPFDFTNVTSALVEFDFYVDTECVGDRCRDKRDELRVVSFTDPSDMDGELWAGDWPSDPSADADGWVAGEYAFTRWNGEPEVWIGFLFVTDGSVTMAHGASIDNVVLSVEQAEPTAFVDRLTTDRQCYTPGSQIGVFASIGTDLGSQAVEVEAQLAQFDVIWSWETRTATAPTELVIQLPVPADAPVGDHVVRVVVRDAASGRYQDLMEVPVRVDPVCGTVTAPVTSTASPTPTGTPSAEATRCPGESFDETKRIFIPPAPGRADILFAFDTTGSMEPVLSSAKSNAVTIMGNLAGLIPDVQFGVVDLRDYELEDYGSSGDWPYRLRQRITGDRAAVQAAINATSAGGGGDAPEAYSRALYESYSDPRTGWRADTRRFVVMFGDDVPHDNNLNQRITSPRVNPGGTWCGETSLGCVLDPGRDATPGTGDDIDFQPTLDNLRTNQITLLFVVSGGGSTSQANLVEYWKQWAGWTGAGGDAVSLGDAANLPAVIQNLVTSASSRIARLELVADPPQYQSWLTVSPPVYTNLTIPPAGLEVTFQVRITVPPGTPVGTVHAFAVRAVGDGAVYGGQGVRIHIPAGCATATATATRRTPTATTTRATPTPTPTATATCPPIRSRVAPSCSDTDYVRNGYLERGSRSWGQYSSGGRSLVSSAAIEGFYSAQFVGQAAAVTDERLYQYYDIPAALDGVSFDVEYLTRVLNTVGTPAVRSGDFFRVSLYDPMLQSELVRLWEFDPTLSTECAVDPPAYNLTPAQLTAVRGRTVALVFHLYKRSRGWQPSILLDGIHLWVCSSGPPCRVEPHKWADPDVVPSGGETTVFLSLTGLDGSCLPRRKPADVMLVIDNSGSMRSDDKLARAQTAAKGFVDRLDLATDRVGLVSFSTSAIRRSALVRDAGPLRAAIDGLQPDAETNIADGVRVAQAELAANASSGSQPVIILLSDGNPNVETDRTEPEATAAKAAGSRIFTIGLGADVDPDLLQRLASSPADYFFAPDADRLDAIYQQIAGVISGSPATNIVIVDRLSDYVTLVPNSFTGLPAPEVSPDGKTLTWRVPRLGIETKVWSYRVRMTRTPGRWPTNTSATATYTDSQGNPASLTFPVPEVTVLAPQDDHPDSMCRDHAADDGSVPSNPNGEAWWDSPDIWVRNARDGGTAHQNPIAGQANYLYARIRNIGDAPLTNVTVRAYDAPGAANILWPGDWVPEIGNASIARLDAGRTEVAVIPWTPSTDGHVCFLVRIEASDDPIRFDGWVPFDNNICQRNLQVIDAPEGSTITTVGGGNRGRVNEHGSWSMDVSNWPSSARGTLKFEDGELFDRWQRNGGTTNGDIDDANKSIDFGENLVALDGRGQHPSEPHALAGSLGAWWSSSGGFAASGRRMSAPPGLEQEVGDAFQLVIARIPYEAEEVASFSISIVGPGGVEPPTIELVEWIDGVAVGGNVLRPPVTQGFGVFLPLLAADRAVGAASLRLPGGWRWSGHSR